jgi:hypothetical protein
MQPSRSAVIANVVAKVPCVVEAHLPQCFIEGDTAARQALIVVVRSKADTPEIAQQISAAISKVIPGGHFVDILPFVNGVVPTGLRESGCQIFRAISRPWWNIW